MKAASVSLIHVLANLLESMPPLRLYANVAGWANCVESVSIISGETVGQQDRKTSWKYENLLWQQLYYHPSIYFTITQIFRTILIKPGQQRSSSFSQKFPRLLILFGLRLFSSPALTELVVVWISASSSSSPPVSAISSRTCWFNNSSSHPERRLHNSANSTPAPPD